MITNAYKKTIRACFVGYIVQAIVNNFAPLLFLTFQKDFEIPLSLISMLVTVNFGVQLIVDVVSVTFADRIGYRASMIIAHALSAAGLVSLSILPDVLPSPFVGVIISVIIYAVGGGLLEVLVSPVVEACPSDNKEKTMSMLHSYYCWGYAVVVLGSTLFFNLAGIENWRLMALIWAVVPICNAIAFTKVPIAPLVKEDESGMRIKELFSEKTFCLLLIMMICAGASEQAVSQWVSAFAEKGLSISKTAGDLVGTLGFAVMQGIARAFYGKFGDSINLDRFMTFSCILCIFAYLGISLMPIPLISLFSCALCGLSVGIMWPGTFSKASKALPYGGTAMFAFLALGGDVGCSLAPTLVGIISDNSGGDLKKGILANVIFPMLLLTGILLLRKLKKSNEIREG